MCISDNEMFVNGEQNPSWGQLYSVIDVNGFNYNLFVILYVIEFWKATVIINSL